MATPTQSLAGVAAHWPARPLGGEQKTQQTWSSGTARTPQGPRPPQGLTDSGHGCISHSQEGDPEPPSLSGRLRAAAATAYASERGRRSYGGSSAASSACSWTGCLCCPPPPPAPAYYGRLCSPCSPPWACKGRAAGRAQRPHVRPAGQSQRFSSQAAGAGPAWRPGHRLQGLSH